MQKGDAEPVMPSPETVLDKSYSPLSRPLYIFVKNSALRRPGVSGFVKFYLENVQKTADGERTIHGGNALATNGILHDTIVARLRG